METRVHHLGFEGCAGVCQWAQAAGKQHGATEPLAFPLKQEANPGATGIIPTETGSTDSRVKREATGETKQAPYYFSLDWLSQSCTNRTFWDKGVCGPAGPVCAGW